MADDLFDTFSRCACQTFFKVRLAKQKREEEERFRAEEADKKAKEAEEKRRRLEEAKKIIIIIIIITRPKPAYGRQGLAGLWGQDTDQAGTFWGVVNISLRA